MTLDSTPADLLPDLVDQFGDALCARGWEEQPSVLLRLATPPDAGPDEVELGIVELDGHPASALLGFVCPEEWSVVGCSGLGWLAPMGGVRPSRHHSRERVRSTALVDRSGAEASCVHWSDGRSQSLGPGIGRIPEVLRRSLGLPTAPPDLPVTAFFARLWIDAVLAATATPDPHGRRLRWGLVAARFPTMAGRDPAHLLEVGAALGRSIGWDGVRWQTVEGQWQVDGVTGETAAWMDDGMFARWVVPTREDLRRVAHRAGDSTARSMAQILRYWGVW